MKMTATLSRYLARSYIFNFVFLLSALLAVVYLFDMVELMRRATTKDVPMLLIFQMGLLKLPEVGQLLLPFAILFSAMLTFWQLTKRYELLAVRSAGFSVWQFLWPLICVALFVGILQIGIVNPIGALLIGKFEQLESRYLTHQDSQIAIFKEGLWLRQDTDEGYMILHADKIEQPGWMLRNVVVLFFDHEDLFKERIDAPRAQIEEGYWRFSDANIYEGPQQKVREESSYNISTQLTPADIEESFSSPETMSFWRLPDHIRTLEDTGFDASRLRVHYHNLLTQPFMFAAMILLAAAVSIRPPRTRGGLMLFVAGIVIGFVVFFTSSFLQALGSSQQIPVVLAAWSPAFITILLGLTIIMNIEDG
ncbi:MAG: LPS export ABC transporter permease LptG [Alphaproteobacteria bacterium]